MCATAPETILVAGDRPGIAGSLPRGHVRVPQRLTFTAAADISPLRRDPLARRAAPEMLGPGALLGGHGAHPTPGQ